MTAAAFAGKLRQAGVMVSVSDTWRGRACLHLDVTAAMVEKRSRYARQSVCDTHHHKLFRRQFGTLAKVLSFAQAMSG